MASKAAGAGPKAGDAAAAASALHEAIEAQFLRAMGRGAEVVETPAFRVHLWPTPDPFYRNVAVPSRRPEDWHPAIQAMRAAFAAAARPPRLEFIEERWPDLAAALERAGLAESARQRLMVATTPPAVPPDGPPVRLLPAAPPVIERYLLAVLEAFAQPLDQQTIVAEAKKLAREIRAGTCRVAVITAEAGRALAGASLIGIDTDAASGPRRIAELAGVWTAPDASSRGFATRVAATLLRGFLDPEPVTGSDPGPSDSLAWLSADGERVTALYSRLGFRPIGWQRNYSAASA